jgi:hypothetical protein
VQEFSDDALMDCVTKATRVPAARFENYCQAVERILHESLTPYAAGEGQRDTNSSWWRFGILCHHGRDKHLRDALYTFDAIRHGRGALFRSVSVGGKPDIPRQPASAFGILGALSAASLRAWKTPEYKFFTLIAADRELAFGKKVAATVILDRNTTAPPECRRMRELYGCGKLTYPRQYRGAI